MQYIYGGIILCLYERVWKTLKQIRPCGDDPHLFVHFDFLVIYLDVSENTQSRCVCHSVNS